MSNLAKVSVVIDDFIEEYQLDCITLRCWEEMQPALRIAPCVLLSELNDRGIVASCEIDLCSAINMYALMLASESPQLASTGTITTATILTRLYFSTADLLLSHL